MMIIIMVMIKVPEVSTLYNSGNLLTHVSITRYRRSSDENTLKGSRPSTNEVKPDDNDDNDNDDDVDDTFNIRIEDY